MRAASLLSFCPALPAVQHLVGTERIMRKCSVPSCSQACLPPSGPVAVSRSHVATWEHRPMSVCPGTLWFSETGLPSGRCPVWRLRSLLKLAGLLEGLVFGIFPNTRPVHSPEVLKPPRYPNHLCNWIKTEKPRSLPSQRALLALWVTPRTLEHENLLLRRKSNSRKLKYLLNDHVTVHCVLHDP